MKLPKPEKMGSWPRAKPIKASKNDSRKKLRKNNPKVHFLPHVIDSQPRYPMAEPVLQPEVKLQPEQKDEVVPQIRVSISVQ